MSVGSNPTQGEDLSEAAHVADVGDGGGGAVLSAVEVGERKKLQNILLLHVIKLLVFGLSKNRITLSRKRIKTNQKTDNFSFH